MSKEEGRSKQFLFSVCGKGRGFFYSQLEVTKLKYATGRFVSWRHLKADAINQRWLLSLYAHCRHLLHAASAFAVVNDCLVFVEFFYMMFENDGNDF
jgi:hypothetical protein